MTLLPPPPKKLGLQLYTTMPGKMHPFKVCTSVVLQSNALPLSYAPGIPLVVHIFIKLCNHYHCPIPEHFCYPQKKLHTY
jgi:hypothetical protein